MPNNGNPINLATMQAALKELYDGQTVEDLTNKKNPLWALMKKEKNFFGSVYPVPNKFANSSGASATFAQAQANQSGFMLSRFNLTRTRDYAIATLDQETMLASSNSAGAFVEAAKETIDSTIEQVANRLGQALYGSGSGTIGQIGTINAGGVIQLAAPGAVVSFEVNQVLQATTLDGNAAGLLAAVGYVVAVNRYLGQITVSAAPLGQGAPGIPGVATVPWAAGMFLLTAGDMNAKVLGLQAWIPATPPTPGSLFLGVDRSIDTRLQGQVYDGSMQTIEEALIDGSALLSREGADPTVLMVSYPTWSALEKSLGSKKVIVDNRIGNVGFKGLQLTGADTTINVYADRNCPAYTGFLLDMSTWAFKSIGDAPRFLDWGAQGNEGWLRMSNADACEVRVGWYGNVYTTAPNRNMMLKLSA